MPFPKYYPSYRVKDKKTGKISDFEWQGENPPTEEELDKLGFTKPDPGFKQGLRKLYEDLRDDALNLDKNLREPIVDLEPYAGELYNFLNPQAAEIPNSDWVKTPEDLRLLSGREGFKKMAGFLSPAPIDIAAMGAGKAGKGAKAVENIAEGAKAEKGLANLEPIFESRSGFGKAKENAPASVANKIDRTVIGGGSSALSAEELSRAARGEKYYKVSRSGQLTYYGAQPDPTKGLRQGEAIVKVVNGKPMITQAMGISDADALGAFGRTEIGRDLGKETSLFTGMPDEKQNAAMAAMGKFAEGKMSKEALQAELRNLGVNAQGVQSILKKVGIKPREVGLSARDLEFNPRAPVATNPRALGTSPRQQALQTEFKDQVGGNIQYPDDTEEKLRSVLGFGPEGEKNAAVAAALNKSGQLDLNDLPDPATIEKAAFEQLAKDNNLNPDIVEEVIKQKYKQQQYQKTRKALKNAAQQQKAPTTPPALTPAQQQQWQNLQNKYGSGPVPPASLSSSPQVPQTQALTTPPSTPPGSPAGAPPSPPGWPSGRGTLNTWAQPPGAGGSPPNFANRQLQRNASFWENLLGIPRSLRSIIDQPLLRQGAIETFSHPTEAFDAWKKGVKSYKEGNYNQIMTDLENHPRFDQMQELGVLEPDVAQQFPSTWAEKAPLIGPVTRGSERNYVGTLDPLRASRFDDVAGKIEADFWKGGMQGPIDPKEYEAAANYVSDVTGRGKLPEFTQGSMAKGLNAVGWSPRFRMSRLSVMNPINYTQAGRYGSKSGIPLSQFRQDMGKFGVGLGGALGTAALLGGDVEIDPRSSDFAQAQFGNTRLDLTGALKPVANMATRSALGFVPGVDTYKSSKTDETSRANNPEGISDYLGNAVGNTLSNVGYYARTGLAPGLPTAAGDLTFGMKPKKGDVSFENVIGEKVEPFSLPYMLEQITPMYPQGAYEAWQDLGPGSIPLSALGLLGAGENTYGLNDGSKVGNNHRTLVLKKDMGVSDKKKAKSGKSSTSPRRSY